MTGASRRQRQAAQTRTEILAAARRLFAEDGYGPTTVAAIARLAGVSVQTIYDSVGSKAAVLRSLSDLVDANAGVREIAMEIPGLDDPAALLDIPIRVTRAILETSGDIVRAATGAGNGELAALRDEGRARHRAGVGFVVARLAQLGLLPDGADADAVADEISLVTEVEVWILAVDVYGWSVDRVAEWCRGLVDQLVDQRGQPSGSSST